MKFFLGIIFSIASSLAFCQNVKIDFKIELSDSNGDIIIGLNDNEIELLATTKDVEKVSLHNIALSLFHKHNAATSVATNIWICLPLKDFITPSRCA